MKTRTFCLWLIAIISAATPLIAQPTIAEKVAREKVAGIDVLAFRMGVADVITFRGSFPAGDIFAGSGNMAVPTLVAAMLDKGTTRHNKFEITQKLDAIGARIGFSAGGVMLEFSGKCLRKDLPLVLSILAEELRMPAFSADEFGKLQKQIAGQMQRAMESPDFRANQAFAETVFPAGHPNYSPPTAEFVAAVQRATVDELKQFHAAHYGPAGATFVAVGDIDAEHLRQEIAKAFDGWSGGKSVAEIPPVPAREASKEQAIRMSDKPNVSVVMGQSSGIKYTDADALALRVGTAVLGRGFTGRLMANVREREGLTYGIGASLSNDSFASGVWQISANFAPQLLEKGLASTMRELNTWHAKGITAAELERMKTNLIGTFKVGLATTDGMAGVLLESVHRGLGPAFLDGYPQRVNGLSLEQVNAAIKKHLHPDKMVLIKAGSLPPPTDRR